MGELLLAYRADVNLGNEFKGCIVNSFEFYVRLRYYCGKRDEANMQYATGEGYTPLHNAAGYCCQPHLVKILLAARADANKKCKIGLTPLEYARHQGDGRVSQELLEAFA